MVWPRVARRLAALAVVTAPRPVAEDSCGLTNSIGNTAILMTQVASKSKAAQSDLHSWLVRRDLESFRRQSSVSRFIFFAFCTGPCCLSDRGKIQLQLEGARKTAMAAINAKRPYSFEPGEGVKSLMS